VSRIATAECFFLKGKSTELAIPIIKVLVFEPNIDLVKVRNAFSNDSKASISSITIIFVEFGD
jgi:hypothetical protein